MNNNTYYKVASSLFLIIAILHVGRVVLGLEAVIGGVSIPLWCSWVAAAIAGYLAARGFLILRK